MAKIPTKDMFALTVECTEDMLGAVVAALKNKAHIVSMNVIETGRKKREEGSSTTQRMYDILQLLKKGPVGRKAIAQSLSTEPGAIDHLLMALKRAKLVVLSKDKGKVIQNMLTAAGKKAAEIKDPDELRALVKGKK